MRTPVTATRRNDMDIDMQALRAIERDKGISLEVLIRAGIPGNFRCMFIIVC